MKADSRSGLDPDVEVGRAGYAVVGDDEGFAHANMVHSALAVEIVGDDEDWVANDDVYE